MLATATPAIVLALVLGIGAGRAGRSAAGPRRRGLVNVWLIHYRAHNGASRRAYVDLPAWYGPRDDPPLPLVISPHGRGRTPKVNSALWGNLPAFGRFAVVNPEGQGRKLTLYSWGDPGQISDLAKMPQFVHQALPWLRINPKRVYVVGGSMGGQEALLLLARDPWLLAGVVAFDAPTNLALRYRDFPQLRCNLRCLRMWKDPLGEQMQQLTRIEVGGSPSSDPRAYAARSPSAYVRSIAFSGVPLELWWSRRDEVVVHSAEQSGRLFHRIKKLNPRAPVEEVVGNWPHTADMNYATKLPTALLGLGLLPLSSWRDLDVVPIRPLHSISLAGHGRRQSSTTRPQKISRDATRDPRRAYPWPIKPFDRQHPIRGNFGDPRTIFRIVDPHSAAVRGRFTFHNGVDIVASPGTPVYPVVSGVVSEIRFDKIVVETGGAREFQYWHLRAAVHVGERVQAQRTVIGYVQKRWDHVHLGEVNEGWLVNPLLHLTPYVDETAPVVSSVTFRNQAGRPLSPLGLDGRVTIVAGAYDLPWPAVPGRWNGMPVTPAVIGWKLTTLDGKTIVPEHVVVDFRRRLPPQYDFWRIYAHGSYQNFPVVGLHYFGGTQGNYLFDLTPKGFDTGRIAPGEYVLTIDASDMGGNRGALRERVRIVDEYLL